MHQLCDNRQRCCYMYINVCYCMDANYLEFHQLLLQCMDI